MSELSFQLLVSCMNTASEEIINKMNIDSDAVFINQCDKYDYEEFSYNGHNIKFASNSERGVGKSRNAAISLATADIIMFSDEDIVLKKGYKNEVLKAFRENPKADMIFFYFDAMPGRETFTIEKKAKVTKYKCGRYSTCCLAMRREKLMWKNVFFSTLFGGGAKYSNGEDSLFILECLKKGMKAIKVPVSLGAEMREGESTWFKGYTEKFFYDRGVLYVLLYGVLAKALAFRFAYKLRPKYESKEMTFKRAYQIMIQGIRGGKKNN